MNYTMEMFQQDITLLANQVEQKTGKPDVFVVPTRSGLLVGAALAYKMNYTPKFLVVEPDHLLRYNKLPPPRSGPMNHVLFVDNFYDSGRTFQMHRESLLKTVPYKEEDTSFNAAFLIVNPSAKPPRGVMFGRKLDRKYDSSFVNFWWEQL